MVKVWYILFKHWLANKGFAFALQTFEQREFNQQLVNPRLANLTNRYQLTCG